MKPNVKKEVGRGIADVHVLRDYRDADALIAELRNPLQTQAVSVRGAAARALGDIGAVESVPALIELLSDESENVRVTAVSSLGKIGGREATDAIAVALEDQSAVVEKVALWWLGQARDERAVEEAHARLQHPSRTMRRVAVTVLGNLGGPDAIPLVEEALKREHFFLRAPFRKALKQLRRKG
jgi:HEAT repeat protein